MGENIVQWDFDKFCHFCDVLDKMVYRADDYAPTVTEINHIIIPNFSHFYKLLIWIDQTGVETKENQESRKMIRTILNKKLVLN